MAIYKIKYFMETLDGPEEGFLYSAPDSILDMLNDEECDKLNYIEFATNNYDVAMEYVEEMVSQYSELDIEYEIVEETFH